LGTWIGSVGTVLAFVVAFWIGIRDGRQRDKAQRDNEAAQARTLIIEAAKGTKESVWHTATVQITNYGTLPFLAVEIERLVIQWLDGQGPWKQTIIDGRRAVLPAGESIRAGVKVHGPDGDQIELTENHLVSAVVSYRDQAGRKWTRWGNVEPERVVVPEIPQPQPPLQGHKIKHV
jgi:hypothetical protein